jgi:uncharacterized protein (DUF608 family)
MQKVMTSQIIGPLCLLLLSSSPAIAEDTREFNGPYQGRHLERVAFPLGGIGAGMVCLEGAGRLSMVSVRNSMDFFSEPNTYAAICVKGIEKGAKVLEGPVQDWRKYGRKGACRGHKGANYGLPRFEHAVFTARFPFAEIELSDSDIPLDVKLTGWSPFIPGDADNSSLPCGALEYTFRNPASKTLESVFSFHSENFMATARGYYNGYRVKPHENGFVLMQYGTPRHPFIEGHFAVEVDGGEATVNHQWFQWSFFDTQTIVWESVAKGELICNPPVDRPVAGASLYVPFTLKPGESKKLTLRMSWYVPKTNLRHAAELQREDRSQIPPEGFHKPWYAGRFSTIDQVAAYWRKNDAGLRDRSARFRDAFFNTNLPPEVLEAVSANLTILKSPTLLRQTDGRLWGYEGCEDLHGFCAGSCSHVYNYQQAIPHLFPDLERSLRRTEFFESQNEAGRQTFRASLPIREASDDPAHYLPGRYASPEGHFGAIIKTYREWRISGDTEWLRSIWPNARKSLEYAIRTWDPERTGRPTRPQHVYDIEMFGPTSIVAGQYLAALYAADRMCRELGEDPADYVDLYTRGRAFFENELCFDGEYFIQKLDLTHMEEPDPAVNTARGQDITALEQHFDTGMAKVDPNLNGPAYRELMDALNSKMPKYQYGIGCLSDGVLGIWMARMAGLPPLIDGDKIDRHLLAVHRYNFRTDLSDHANPQRPGYALGKEGGLLLCSWPKGGKPALPFVYSDEVWTGIEYQVASHLIMRGFVEKGLEIVRTARKRYDGTVRNPFSEYEAGHWYARALSSYGLLQALTGVRYDAVEKTLYLDPKVEGDFTVFLSTATGFGNAGLKNGRPFVKMVTGTLDVQRILVSGEVFSP